MALDVTPFIEADAVGAYVNPPMYFSSPDPRDRSSAAAIIADGYFGDVHLFVTRNGGFFSSFPERAETHDGMSSTRVDYEHKGREVQFLNRVARAINAALCELALRGFTFEPASAACLGEGAIDFDRKVALVTSASGVHIDRQLFWSDRLCNREDESWLNVRSPGSVVKKPPIGDVMKFSWARKLAQKTPILPRIVAMAHYQCMSGHAEDAILTGWQCVEQMIDAMWADYVERAEPSRKRRSFLGSQSFPVSVRLEVLTASGVIDSETQDHISVFRRTRNEVIHRAGGASGRLKHCMGLLAGVIGWFLGESVSQPQIPHLITSMKVGGGDESSESSAPSGNAESQEGGASTSAHEG